MKKLIRECPDCFGTGNWTGWSGDDEHTQEGGCPRCKGKGILIMYIWTCKIGADLDSLPDGADLPMRQAVMKAFKELTGEDPYFCFTGWGGKLDQLEEGELKVIELRQQVDEKVRKDG